MIKSRLYLDLSFQSFVSEMSNFEKNSINSYRLDNRYSIVNSKCINHLLVCLEDRISVFEFEIAKQGRLDLHFATPWMQTAGDSWRVFLKMIGGGNEERGKEKRERGGAGRRDDRTSESVSRMHTHTRGPALVKRSAIPRDIVPALNQVRLPLNCWLTLSQVHGRIRKTKESLTSTATMHRGTAAHSNELLAIAKMTTKEGGVPNTRRKSNLIRFEK